MKMIINLGWDDYLVEAPAAQLEGLLELLNKAVPVMQRYTGNVSVMVHTPERAREFVGHTFKGNYVSQEDFDHLKAQQEFDELAKKAASQLAVADASAEAIASDMAQPRDD